jgi:hypothetical protein
LFAELPGLVHDAEPFCPAYVRDHDVVERTTPDRPSHEIV